MRRRARQDRVVDEETGQGRKRRRRSRRRARLWADWLASTIISRGQPGRGPGRLAARQTSAVSSPRPCLALPARSRQRGRAALQERKVARARRAVPCLANALLRGRRFLIPEREDEPSGTTPPIRQTASCPRSFVVHVHAHSHVGGLQCKSTAFRVEAGRLRVALATRAARPSVVARRSAFAGAPSERKTVEMRDDETHKTQTQGARRGPTLVSGELASKMRCDYKVASASAGACPTARR